MASPSVARLTDDPIEYIRWPSADPSYPVEINADVLLRLPKELAAAEKLGVETGGLLFGSLKLAPVPTIWVDKFELIAPGTAESPIYMLKPEQQAQFAAARQSASVDKTIPVGFFRNHVRSGPLTLSLADKSFLWKEFRSSRYCALLIGKEQPRSAACFVYTEGRLVSQSAVSAFPFQNQKSVERIPQDSHETAAPVAAKVNPVGKQQSISREVLILSSVLTFALGVVLWPLWQATFGGAWVASSPADIALSIQPHGGDINVTWNRQMPEISRAESATLTFIENSHRQELLLAKDDLKFGAVTYAHPGQKLQVKLALIMDDGTSLTQSAIWQKQ